MAENCKKEWFQNVKNRIGIWKNGENGLYLYPIKKPFIFALSMKQIHALTAEQEHYKEVMSPFEAGMQYFLLEKDNKQ